MSRYTRNISSRLGGYESSQDDLGSFVIDLIGVLAPVGLGLYQIDRQAAADRKARKREEARLAELARQRALAGRYRPPPTKRSKAGLFIGLGVAALVSIVGVIILVVVVKKKGDKK